MYIYITKYKETIVSHDLPCGVSFCKAGRREILFEVKRAYLGEDIIKINGKLYSKKKLCIDWFTMTNDIFFETYRFNFNPHEYSGLYEWGRREIYNI